MARKTPRGCRHVRVRVFTEEYAIHVYLGDIETVNRKAQERVDRACPNGITLDRIGDVRGIAWNTLPKHNPIIGVASDLSLIEAVATLAHEASHAMDFIAENIGLQDGKGEFRAHGISCVIRQVGPLLRGRA